MNEVNALLLGNGDDALDVEIGGDGAFAGADEIGLVGLEAMHPETVLLGEHGDGAEAEFGGGAKNTDGDFAAIGGEKFLRRADFARIGGAQIGRGDAGVRIAHNAGWLYGWWREVVKLWLEDGVKDAGVRWLRRLGWR